jgi:hydrogenase maturation factor
MTAGRTHHQRLSLRGEVVEIAECEGGRRLKITVEPHNLVDVPVGMLKDAHLGDWVRVEVEVKVERVSEAAAESSEPRRGPDSNPRRRHE